jgi:hypothetical protein
MDQFVRPDPSHLEPLRSIPLPLSNVAAELRIKRGRIRAAWIFSAFLALVGLGLVAVAFEVHSRVLWYLPGLGLLLAGLGLVFLVKRVASLRVLVFPHGLVIAVVGQGSACRCYRL